MGSPTPEPRSGTAIELPTLAVGVAVHGAWVALTLAATSLPAWVVCGLGGFVVAWHGSFQHETIHGHPTRSAKVNAMLGSLPLGLWLPYGIYREQHVAHHRTPELTDPLDDPESYYVTNAVWSKTGTLGRAWLHAQSTLFGRLLLGPPALVFRFLHAELARIVGGDFAHARAWAAHIAGVVAVVAWLVFACHMSIAQYVLSFVYPGMALTLLRSFAEHRPAEIAAHRIAIVEGGLLTRLMYLNNNLHVVHHDTPSLPWYEIPARYEACRSEIRANNGDYVFPGYLSLLARYAVRPKDSPIHPAR